MFILTRLSLSLGGNCGSAAEGLAGGVRLPLGFSATGVVSVLGIDFFFFAAEGGGGAIFLGVFSSDGAPCVTHSPDFEMIATLVPGSTVSPSFAIN